MQAFSYLIETRIVFGLGAVDQISAQVSALEIQRALVVTDQGIVQAGLLEKVTQPLANAGIEFAVFDEIEPNPRDTTILKGAQAAQDFEADVVIGLGGGSPMDAAKAIAVMAVNEPPLDQYCGVGADP